MAKPTSPGANGLFSSLVEIMARLRGPSGCPWDREQDHRSLRPCLLEETYEVLEAVDLGDFDALRQELGDLLLQVVFHAQLASEVGEFDIEDVVLGLRDKLVARHPHVFGESEAATAEEVLHQWDSLKRRERDDAGDAVTEVPRALPALYRAQLVRRRAARAGLGEEQEAALEAARRALDRIGAAEGGAEAEAVLGELLLAAVDLAQQRGIDAEQALRERTDRIIERLQSERPAG